SAGCGFTSGYTFVAVTCDTSGRAAIASTNPASAPSTRTAFTIQNDSYDTRRASRNARKLACDRCAVDVNASNTNSPRAPQSDTNRAPVRSADSRRYTHTDVEPSAASSSHTCRSTDATGPDLT